MKPGSKDYTLYDSNFRQGETIVIETGKSLPEASREEERISAEGQKGTFSSNRNFLYYCIFMHLQNSLKFALNICEFYHM